ncbi:MAG TPA: type II toxin-antitoxin system RelE/ParE family toxin [Stellaceae bacterium]
MSYRLTEAAAADIADILRETTRQFGPVQRRRYAALITRAIEMAAEEPARPGSRSRDDLAPGLHSLHVEIAARRRGAAVHVIYYLPASSDDARGGIVVVRVLHEHMEPLRHLSRGFP